MQSKRVLCYSVSNFLQPRVKGEALLCIYLDYAQTSKATLGISIVIPRFSSKVVTHFLELTYNRITTHRGKVKACKTKRQHVLA